MPQGRGTGFQTSQLPDLHSESVLEKFSSRQVGFETLHGGNTIIVRFVVTPHNDDSLNEFGWF